MVVMIKIMKKFALISVARVIIKDDGNGNDDGVGKRIDSGKY